MKKKLLNRIMLKKLEIKIKKLTDKINFIKKREVQRKYNKNFDLLCEDTVVFKVGSDFVPVIDYLLEAIRNTRNKLTNETGFVFPLIRVLDYNDIQENELIVSIQGKDIYNEFFVCTKKEIEKETDKIIRKIYDEYLDEIFTNELLEKYINQVSKKSGWLVWDILKVLLTSDLKYLLISLLKNGKSIKNITNIFEKISDILNYNYRFSSRMNLYSLERALNNLIL
ncbi:MAG: hypothetical protein IJY61_06800 [Candidatus Gastranaerophilales bacterium]|nr:hypothetical protein [Candidatus Gastranaerophilales bacterium]